MRSHRCGKTAHKTFNRSYSFFLIVYHCTTNNNNCMRYRMQKKAMLRYPNVVRPITVRCVHLIKMVRPDGITHRQNAKEKKEKRKMTNWTYVCMDVVCDGAMIILRGSGIACARAYNINLPRLITARALLSSASSFCVECV